VLLWRTRQLLASEDGSGSKVKPSTSPIAGASRKRAGKAEEATLRMTTSAAASAGGRVRAPGSGSAGNDGAAPPRGRGDTSFEEEPLTSDDDEDDAAAAAAVAAAAAEEASWRARREREAPAAQAGAKAGGAVAADGRSLNRVARQALERLLSGALTEVTEHTANTDTSKEGVLGGSMWFG
jgi:hypothetical protein